MQYVAHPSSSHEREQGRKIKLAFYATLMFAGLSYVGVFRAVNVMYNAISSRPFEIVDEQGAPTLKGLVVHSALFFIGMLILISKK